MKLKRYCTSGTLFSLFLLLGALTGPGQVRLNEVMADNNGALMVGLTKPDYVELYNTTNSAVDIGGWSLTDQTNTPAKYIFPANTTVPAHGYLVVYCDSVTNEPGIHTGFSLKATGEEVGLYEKVGTNYVLRDHVEFGLQIEDRSINRIPVGTGIWQLGPATPGATNQSVPLGSAFVLRLNEWLATNSLGPDLLEIYNPTNLPLPLGGVIISGKTTSPSTSAPLPPLSFIEANSYFTFICDSLAGGNGADHLEFRLSSTSGETNTIFWTNRTTIIDRIRFGPQARDTSMGRLPDGGTNFSYFPTTNYMSFGDPNKYQPITNLLVSELLTHTDPPFEDAIELLNPTPDPVDISHWWLSDDSEQPQKFRVPANTIIPGGGMKVFYEYAGTGDARGFNKSGTGITPNFTLNSAHGGTVYLSEGTAGGALTGFQLDKDFGPAQNGVSFGRYMKSGGGADTVAMKARTFGADAPASVAQFRAGTGLPNTYPLVGPLVISEIMYRPPDIIIGTNVLDNSIDEFIEFHNITSSPLPLYDPAYPTNHWQLSGAVDFIFPANTVAAAHGVLLLVNFDPATNAAQLASFRSRYALNSNIPIFGPYGGKLNNKSDTIELSKPDPVQLAPHLDAGFVPFVVVERIKYEDSEPWPTNTDGTGYSLQRLSLAGYGNDKTNWVGAAPSAGLGTRPIEPVSILVQPVSQYVSAGSEVSFSVTAAGSEPIQYQWSYNNIALQGGTGPTLTLDSVQLYQSGTLVVTVANAAGSVTSDPAILSVAGAPTLSAPLSMNAGRFQLTLGGVPGHLYRVEASTNLTSWVPLGLYTNGGPVMVTDTNSASYTYRFYRAILLP